MDYKAALFIVGCYLFGSINFAVIISKARGKDVRTAGSGNPGTMNMLRYMGIGWGALTFVCDALKGAACALVGMFVFNLDIASLAGAACALGHVFPIFLKFKGGKGVAVSVGFFACLLPAVALPLLAAFIAYLFFFKYGFLGSVLYVSTLSIVLASLYPTPVQIGVCVFLIALNLFCHRKNFVRWIKKEENSMRLIDKLRDKKSRRESGSCEDPKETLNETRT